MNLTDRIYLAVHVALTLLVCARWQHVTNGPPYVVWNAIAIAAVVLLARSQKRGTLWEFAHGWLPVLFFFTVFEEVSYLSLALRSGWQNPMLIVWESALFSVPPAERLHHYSAQWFTELLEFCYLSFYLLYPTVAGVLWILRGRPHFRDAFRHLTDSLSVGYAVCYATYLFFPTRSPSHNVGLDAGTPSQSGGPFHHFVDLIQSSVGVHGNAFPSSHIMLACVVLVFVFRYLPRFALPLLLCIILMCAGAVYDGYHYPLDVLAGALLGIAVAIPFASAKRPSPRQEAGVAGRR
jgi:membrane-associated phospholipid phosphatase